MIVFAVVIITAQAFCCGTVLSNPEPPYTVDPSNETLDRLQERIESIEADNEGQFVVTITEEEVTALAEQTLEEMQDPPPISQPQVLFRNDRVELYGTIHASNTTDVLGMLALTVDVQDGDVLVTVEEIDVGPLPVPESLTEMVTERLNDALDNWILNDMGNYTITDIRIGDKKALIYGQASDG
jgi:uncharacterized protein YpmS